MRKVRFNESCMGDYLKRHDLIYDVPAPIWDKGIPMANSVVSVVIWGEDHLNVSMTRNDIWEMRRYSPDPEKFKWSNFEKLVKEGTYSNPVGIVQTKSDKGPTAQLLPLGRFEVHPKGKIKQETDYNMCLHLYDGITTGRFLTDLGSVKWDCHVSAEHPCIVFNYETFEEEELSFRFRFCSDVGEYTKEYHEVFEFSPARFMRKLCRGYDGPAPEMARVLKDWGYKDSIRGITDGISYWQQEIPENGNYCVAWINISRNNGTNTLIVTVTMSQDNQAVSEALNNIKQYTSNSWLTEEMEEHKKWWHSVYPKSFYSINDTKLEALYWINWYKLAAMTKKNGIAPNMNGIWVPDDGTLATLGATYIWNTQQETVFFGAYGGNRLEATDTTFDLLKNNRDKMRDYAERFFGVEGGEFLAHITDYQLGCQYYSANNFELLCGPWMCQMMWQRYLYTLDEAFLKEYVYPMMKAQCRIPMSLLVKEEDGYYHLPTTMSAEYPPLINGKASGKKYDHFWGKDATCDIAQLKFMCETLLEIERILKIEDEDEEKWKDTLKYLVPFKYDSFGGLSVRGDLDYTSSHRHLTHLFPITQLYQITNETEEGRRIIERSLHALIVYGTGEWMGWTFSEAAKIALLANKPAMAYQLIHEYADKFVSESTFDTDGSNNQEAFVIHDNMGLTVDSDGMFNEALQNFTLRSYNGNIYCMDVLPKSFRDIEFYNLRTEGAFLLSGKRTNGFTEFIDIYSEKGQTVRLKSCFGLEVDVYCDDVQIEYTIEGDKVVFDTEENKEYLVVKKGYLPKNLMISAVQPLAHELNVYGLKKDSRY